MDAEYERRRGLTFRQAEGLDPLPSQMDRTTLTKALRAELWSILELQIGAKTRMGVIASPMADMLYRVFRHHLHDLGEFSSTNSFWVRILTSILKGGDYAAIFGLIQFIVRDPACDDNLRGRFARALDEHQAAFRLVNHDTVVPFASDAEIRAYTDAVSNTAKSEFRGANAHLLGAADLLGKGDFAGSVRESIHAVESVARTVTETEKLSDALNKIEKERGMHKALKSSFLSLYGYASDEEGIRHALLEKGSPAVTESEALFMLGACAAFSTYLIDKNRASAG